MFNEALHYLYKGKKLKANNKVKEKQQKNKKV